MFQTASRGPLYLQPRFDAWSTIDWSPKGLALKLSKHFAFTFDGRYRRDSRRERLKAAQSHGYGCVIKNGVKVSW